MSKASTSKKIKAAAIATEEIPAEIPTQTLPTIEVIEVPDAPEEAAEAPTEEAPAATIEEEPAATSSEEPDIIKAEENYGHSRLKDLLAEGLDAFLDECRQGLEPAVATAIYGNLLKVGTRKVGTPKADIPHNPKSTCANPTRKVWDIADAATAKLENIPSRGDVVKEAIAAGVSTGTARTQFQCWYTARKPEFIKKGWLKA